PNALDALFDGADVAVNAIGILREIGDQTFRKMHVTLAKRLVASSQAQGVGHLIQISALGVTDEADTPYFRTKFEAEQIIRSGGHDWTILRPSLVLGDGSGFMDLVKGWATGRHSPYFFLPYFTRKENGRTVAPKVAPLDVADLAWAVCESIENPNARGEVIHLTGPDVYEMPDLLLKLREHIRNARPNMKTRGVPGALAARLAGGAARLGLGDALPFDMGMAIMGARDSVAPMRKARAILGYDPGSIG
ncbi:MAG: NAD(P)H-binding protein, partial [Phycisphaerales bacterium]|nr:NAD(P)H-binding protein [Phycisphaerales bacterium]